MLVSKNTKWPIRAYKLFIDKRTLLMVWETQSLVLGLEYFTGCVSPKNRYSLFLDGSLLAVLVKFKSKVTVQIGFLSLNCFAKANFKSSTIWTQLKIPVREWILHLQMFVTCKMQMSFERVTFASSFQPVPTQSCINMEPPSWWHQELF